MKHLALALMLLALPARAQETPPSGLNDGMDLMQRGMQSMLEGLADRMEPALEDMGEALTRLRPMAEELFGLIDDIGSYEAPVVLENGDILIRRKPEQLKEGEIEL